MKLISNINGKNYKLAEIISSKQMIYKTWKIKYVNKLSIEIRVLFRTLSECGSSNK